MKKIKYIIVFLLCLLFTTNEVNAKSYVKDLFQYNDNLVIKEELDGTAFLVGNKVTVENNINGIGLIAGETININGEEEYLISVGTTLNIEGNIKNDAFLIGQDIKIKGSIDRDLYIYSNSIVIEGTINRNSYIYAGSVELKGKINGDVLINAVEINVDKDLILNGTLRYNEDAVINGLTDAINSKTYKIDVEKYNLKDYMISFINNYLHISILAIVLVFTLEKILKKSLEQTKNITTKTITILCGKGFLILIGVPIVVMMLLFSGLLVSVGIISALIYIILLYVSNIFAAYFIANKLDKKYFKKKMNSYMLVIIGLFIIKIVSIIPIIGPIISLLTMLLGLGITGNMLIEIKK